MDDVQQSGERPGGLRRLAFPLASFAAFVLCVGALFLVQRSAGRLASADDFYHVKLAWLLRTEGWLSAFPWLDATVFRDGWVDHQLLFHVLLVPFTLGDLTLGGQLAAAAFGALGLVGVALAVRRLDGAAPLLWPVFLLASAWSFVYRVVQLRVQALALCLLILAVVLLVERRFKALAVLAFLFAWTYHGAMALAPMAMLHLGIVYLRERRWEWRGAAAVAAGLALGFVVNPFFPRSVGFLYLHAVVKLLNRAALPVGLEWAPYPPLELLVDAAPVLLVLAAGLVAWKLARGSRRESTALALALALFFGVATLRSRRFIEYWPAFVALFAALSLRDLRASLPPASRWGRRLRSKGAVLAVAALMAIPALDNLVWLRGYASEDDSCGVLRGAAGYLEAHSAPGDVVFNTHWGDFAELFFHNHRNRYLAGLDPTFTYAWNPSRFAAYRAIARGRMPSPGFFAQALFGARFVLARVGDEGILAQAQREASGLVEVFRDERAVVFRVAPVAPVSLAFEGSALRPDKPLGLRCVPEGLEEQVLSCPLSAGAPARIEVPVPAGRYRVRLELESALPELRARWEKGEPVSSGGGRSLVLEPVDGPALAPAILESASDAELKLARVVLEKVAQDAP